MNNQAVIFDLDGVLITSEHLKARAHAEAVRSFGGAAEAAFYGRVMGQDHASVRAAFLREGGIDPAPEAYSNAYRESYERLLASELNLAPGVAQLLPLLRAREYRLAIATSSQRWMVDLVFSLVDLERRFDLVITANDVTRHKPDPEAYVLALDRLRAAASTALVVEDSEPGVAAAAAAGIRVLAVRHECNRTHDLTRAWRIVDSLDPPEQTLAVVEQALGG